MLQPPALSGLSSSCLVGPSTMQFRLEESNSVLYLVLFDSEIGRELCHSRQDCIKPQRKVALPQTRPCTGRTLVNAFAFPSWCGMESVTSVTVCAAFCVPGTWRLGRLRKWPRRSNALERCSRIHRVSARCSAARILYSSWSSWRRMGDDRRWLEMIGVYGESWSGVYLWTSVEYPFISVLLVDLVVIAFLDES